LVQPGGPVRAGRLTAFPTDAMTGGAELDKLSPAQAASSNKPVKAAQPDTKEVRRITIPIQRL